MPNLSGNKGEWSEVYVFLKLMEDKRLFCLNEQLRQDANTYLNILEIYRKSTALGSSVTYNLGEKITVSRADLVDADTIDDEKVKEAKEKVFAAIRMSHEKSSAFRIPEVEDFLSGIYVTEVKAPSTDKKDIDLKQHDPRNGLETITGYSIKSYMGSKPTLINASGATNFVFRINGFDDEKMEKTNAFGETQNAMDYIINNCSGYDVIGADNPKAKKNLDLLDPRYSSEIIPRLLWHQFEVKNTHLDYLCKSLDPTNELYEFKMKKLLTTCALGMSFGKNWNRREDANGGFINVEKTGDVFAIHFFNRNVTEDYLFYSTCLDRGGRGRHGWGKVYKEDSEYRIKLNFQVRFYK